LTTKEDMAEKRKKFRVRCPHCDRSFNVRYGLQDVPEDAEATGTVVVECLHCGEPSTITVPRDRIEPDFMVRGIAIPPHNDA
jgi:phage terminase large subunit GpA-like protein